MKKVGHWGEPFKGMLTLVLYCFYVLADKRRDSSPIRPFTMRLCFSQAHSNKAKLTWTDTSETTSPN